MFGSYVEVTGTLLLSCWCWCTTSFWPVSGDAARLLRPAFGEKWHKAKCDGDLGACWEKLGGVWNAFIPFRVRFDVEMNTNPTKNSGKKSRARALL